MGLVYRTATIDPTKQELAAGWVPTRPWGADRSIAGKVAEYRLDDPAGEVGVETILWQLDDGSVCQVPFTYRAAPLEGAEEHLIGTTEHTVLGTRWVYDGCADPVWAATMLTAITTGGTQSQMFFEQDGRRVDVPPRMQVRGSGAHGRITASRIERVVDDAASTTVSIEGHTVRLHRRPAQPAGQDDVPVLLGHVGPEGDDGPWTVLATLLT